MGGSLFPLLWKIVLGSVPATYTISGTVVDGNAVGLSGVTITLSGDASDSTVTTGDGSWSFTDMPNGTYTVTPGHTHFSFTPASSDASVAGGDKAVSALTLTFPIYIDFENDTIGQNAADWDVMEGSAATLVASISSDLNSYSPAGYTKEVYASDPNTYRVRIGYDLQAKYGLNIPTQFKIQFLSKRTSSTDTSEVFSWVTGVGTDEAWTGAFLHMINDEVGNQYTAADHDGSGYQSWGSAGHDGVAVEPRYWNFYNMAYRTDTTPNKMETGIVRMETGGANGPRGINEDAGYTPTTYATPAFGSQQGASFGTVHVARVWIGNYSDTYPTS